VKDMKKNYFWIKIGCIFVLAFLICGTCKAKGKPGTKYDYTLNNAANTIKTFLFGRITSLDKNEQGNFRFLPITVLYISRTTGQPPTIKILKEVDGEYPCCGYIPINEFKGIVTGKFIIGTWTTIIY